MKQAGPQCAAAKWKLSHLVIGFVFSDRDFFLKAACSHNEIKQLIRRMSKTLRGDVAGVAAAGVAAGPGSGFRLGLV